MEKEHGKIEHRQFWMVDAEELPAAQEWVGLRSVGLADRERTIKENFAKIKEIESC